MALLRHGLISTPATDAIAIVPSDTVDLATAVRGIYVGGVGAVTVITLEGTTVTFTAPVLGMVIPICATRVMATGTTATLLIGLL